MESYIEKYVYRVLKFDYYNSSFFALCIGSAEDGRLICYRVRQGNKEKLSWELLVEDLDGNNTEFVVEYGCKFRIHPECVRKCLFVCNEAFIIKINQKYHSLPPLKVLTEEYKELKAQYYHTPTKEGKCIRKKMGELAHQIDARQAIFLQEAKLEKGKKQGKYRNFRHIPNKDGISRMYTGGSCSGK